MTFLCRVRVPCDARNEAINTDIFCSALGGAERPGPPPPSPAPLSLAGPPHPRGPGVPKAPSAWTSTPTPPFPGSTGRGGFHFSALAAASGASQSQDPIQTVPGKGQGCPWPFRSPPVLFGTDRGGKGRAPHPQLLSSALPPSATAVVPHPGEAAAAGPPALGRACEGRLEVSRGPGGTAACDLARGTPGKLAGLQGPALPPSIKDSQVCHSLGVSLRWAGCCGGGSSN